MTFTPIDRSRWDREEYFSYFSQEVPCLYSMTLNLDVTPVMKRRETLSRHALFPFGRRKPP